MKNKSNKSLVRNVLASVFGVCLVLGILNFKIESDRNEKNSKKSVSQSTQVFVGEESDQAAQKENEASKEGANTSQVGNGESGSTSLDEKGNSADSKTKISRKVAPYASGAGAWAVNSATKEQKKTYKIVSQIDPRRSISEILESADMSDPETRAVVVAFMSNREEVRYQAVLAKAELLGIPVRLDGPSHKVSILYDFRGEEPLYRTTLNVNAAISTGANLIRQTAPYNLDGSGIKVGVWDGGSVRNTHQEFNTTRVVKKNSTVAVDDHATHVAGTIGASGFQASAKGMAPLVAIDSYDWNSDSAEMTAVGAATANDSFATKIPLSNHSYGYDAVTADMGRYETECNTLDALALSLPYYLVFWAAGNEQDTLTALGGYQSITYSGLSKNILTVGAGDDAVTSGVRDVTKGTLAYFSSMGPCDDGRIKPDLVANGVNVNSCISTSDTAYNATYSGTSMATPNAAGSAALLVQLYSREFSSQRMRSSMLKALLIHTTDDVGRPGPDYQYGWGYLNVKAAADVILAHKASLAAPKMVDDLISNSSKTKSYNYDWDGTSPLKATLCWTDPAGTAQTAADSRTPNLKHNLDLKITAPDGATIYQPYTMPFVGTWTQASMTLNATKGKNNVDNVERVDVPTPTQTGTYIITVSLDGTLSTSTQAFSLIVTGASSAEANPPPTVSLTSPLNGAAVLPGQNVTLTATAADMANGGQPGSVSKVEFLYGTTVIPAVSTGTGTYSATWTPTSPGTYLLTARATDSEEAVTTSSQVEFSVLSGDGSPSISSFSPASGAAGTVVTITGSNFAGVTAVRFNGFEATTYTVDSLTQITATVPTTATTGLVTVLTSRGVANSSTNFTIVQSPVLISQVYGGGGDSGSTLNSDYVEIYNRSVATVNLVGWSVQYAAASGATWSVGNLSGSIGPGKYHLVKLAGGANGAALPTADSTPTTSINMSATQGKVALRNTTTSFTGSSPIGQAGLQDFLGYGTANAYEGSGAAPSPSKTKAIFRSGGGAGDTGDNKADFAASTPNPRNSSFGSMVAPVITSPATANGAVGQSFSYQIAANNSPTSFNAAGLPEGLTVSTSTGLISGTPKVAATSTVTISATNSAGTNTVDIFLTIASASLPVTVFSENMGSPVGTTQIASNTFQNSNLVFSGTGDVRSTSNSSGYAAASAGGNIYISNMVDTSFVISGIDTRTYSSLSLSFGQLKSTLAANNELVVEVSADGITYDPLSYSRPTGSGTATWMLVTPSGTIPATTNLRIRFRQTSISPQFRIDDVKLTGVVAVSPPSILTGGSPSAVSAVYGAASTATSFTIGGQNLTAGILVTPPAGFEVSQTVGGTSGYASTQTIAGTGTIVATTVFIRLAEGQAAGFYSGNLVCSSGAVSTTLAVPEAEVRKKGLNITANNRNKAFGQTITLGAGQAGFATTGLVGSQIVGTVTLTASGGTGTNDAAGTYVLTPSSATGGTFSEANYNINYLPGVLTVQGRSYSDWSSDLTNGAPTADADGNGLSNLMEYYMGISAESPLIGPPVTVSNSGTTISMTYRRYKGLDGVQGTVEHIGDLTAANWDTNGVTVKQVVDRGTYEEVTVEVALATGEAKMFMRLRVTQP